LAADIAPLSEAYRDQRRAFAADAKARQTALLAQAATIAPGDTAATAAFQKAFAEHEAQSAREAAIIKALRDEQIAAENIRSPELAAARAASNRIEEERQFLRKRLAL